MILFWHKLSFLDFNFVMLLGFRSSIWFYREPVDFRNYVKFSIMCSNWRSTREKAIFTITFTAHNFQAYVLTLTLRSAYQVL